MGINSLTVTGNLGKDPELLYLESGKSVTKFSLAVSLYRPAGSATMWLDCDAWGKVGELIAEYCKKGSTITVSGSLDENHMPAKGEYPEKKVPKIVVRDVQLPPKQAESPISF